MAARSRFSEATIDVSLMNSTQTDNTFFAFNLTTFYSSEYTITLIILAWSTLGLLPNVANIIVFAKMGFSETINIMFCVLSVADLIFLLVNVFSTSTINMAYEGVRTAFIDVSDLSLIINPFTWSSFCLGSCATALIAVERSVCIAFPLKVKTIFTRRRVMAAILFFFSLTLANLIQSYATMSVIWITLPNTNQTGLVLNYTEYFQYWVVVAMFAFSVVPSFTAFIVVIVGTTFLVIKLNQSARWRMASTASTADAQKNRVSTKEVKVIRSATLICIVYIVCFAPNVCLVLASIFEPRLHIGNVYFGLFMYIAFYIAYIFQSISSSSNIFIYLTTSTRYKETFMQIFCRSKDKIKK